MNPEQVWARVIGECEHPTVLLDLGASAGPPAIWKAIASSCSYVAFEPDQRSNGDLASDGFKANVIVRAAATDVDQASVRLYLTRSRFCSSTLVPEEEDLQKFVFAALFDVESTAEVQATTIDRALRAHSLDRIHWFKADTQGTDLRLFRSLPDELRAGVLAVDVEPGLISAYHGEDSFPEVHEYFTTNGFWLSSMTVGTNARGSRRTLRRMLANPAADVESVPSQYRQTPVCCEARYLRELVPGALKRDDLAVLAVFAAMDHQPIFAVEAIEAIRPDECGGPLQALADQCTAALRATGPGGSSPRSRLGRRLRL